ncbi:MAG: asparagine synthase C-terminal domain-containing protein [Lautropia sp.]|nr:asparagine synthase C-terminal domain-containing protein [Lautropia sp.]
MSVNGNFLLVIRPAESPQQPGHATPDLASITASWPGPDHQSAARHLQANLPDGRRFTLQWQGEGWQYIGNEQVGAVGMSNGPHGDDFTSVMHTWVQERHAPVERCRGRFVLIAWDMPQGIVTVITDAFKTWPVCHVETDKGMACASDMRLLVETALFRPELSDEAIYHYLNFYYVPARSAIYRAVQKLPGGQRLIWKNGQTSTEAWWTLHYPEDINNGRERDVVALREHIIDTVRSYRPDHSRRWGAFLSGGTDSSSICGILASSAAPVPVSSFSIGFTEAGYDELGYATIASRAFGLDAHQRRVSEQEAAEALPILIRTFDEPFGNASAIPTYFCARMAADAGKDLLIAGDGGDEIFGGNERYLKDRFFSLYYRSPALLRALGSKLAQRLEKTDQRWANRIRNFIERGSLPNPDRFYTDDSFASDHYDELLTADFRHKVARNASLDLQRAVWQSLTAPSELHRLMHLDLTMAIADNDIIKVTGACRSAGVSVLFPYLDRNLVEYTAHLPAHYKLHGMQKRALFKQAMMSILPEEIRRKKKQGFGLPVSLWMRGHGPFRQLLNDTLESPNARLRDVVQMDTVRRLLDRHQRGAWDHASELYQLLVLELWLQRHAHDTQH